MKTRGPRPHRVATQTTPGFETGTDAVRSPDPVHAFLDLFLDQAALTIATRAEKAFARIAARRASTAHAVRACPYPNCRHPGAGPRNRWFCQDHARSVPVREQTRILVAQKETDRLARLAREGRTLEMRCRIPGCKNISRGPRFSYICDKHRSELSAKEQRDARKRWKAARVGRAHPQTRGR